MMASNNTTNTNNTSSNSSNTSNTSLYLNIVVNDASEAVKEIVSKKIENSSVVPGNSSSNKTTIAASKKMKRFLTKVGTKMAEKQAQPAKVAKRLGQDLPVIIPKVLQEKGLLATAETVFIEGPFVVIQLHILKVDTVVMTKAIQSSFDIVKSLPEGVQDDWSKFLNYSLDFFGAREMVTDDLLPKIVRNKIISTISKQLDSKLKDHHKLDADTVILRDTQQADYFFNQLKQIRNINNNDDNNNSTAAKTTTKNNKNRKNNIDDDTTTTNSIPNNLMTTGTGSGSTISSSGTMSTITNNSNNNIQKKKQSTTKRLLSSIKKSNSNKIDR